MKNVWLISLNTLKEIRRHKIFYAFGGMVLLLIGGGLILAPLSVDEQTRLSINFSITACHIGLMILAVYFASTLISHEIEKKTIITVFVKPLSRMQFVLGKFLGLAFILGMMVLFLSLFLVLVYLFFEQPVEMVLFIALWGILLEALILSAVAFLFSSITSSFLVLVYSVFVFIIGHATNGIVFFLQQAKGNIFKPITKVVVRIMPNFEKLNWRSHALYQDELSMVEVFYASVYGLAWITFLLILAAWLFKRKRIA